MKILITLFLAVLCAFPGGFIRVNAQTRDTWRSVRTNNLFVIGNADAEKLRQVAVWLEFFHSAFGRLVSHNVIDSSVPTTVILFRDEASFLPFKPLYQGRPANVSGYFQPGDDVNYIAISLDPSERDPFGTAFHEYIHLHVKDNIPGAPLWLNEGLAEFYGSLQFSNGEAILGTPLMHYIRYLRGQELLPLSTLFSIGTNSEHYNESDKTGIFYGQSWALVHYLMLGDRGRQDQFKRFLQQITRGDSSQKAIEDAYGVTLPVLEQELRAYIRRADFPSQRITSADNPQAYTAYTAMQRTSLTEGEANHYLGDLLLHIGRPADAERYFKQAITLDPGFAPAHAALGRLYVQQRRYAEAKKYLEPLTRDSDQSVRREAQELLNSLTGLSQSKSVATVSSTMIAEPVQTGTARVLGGDSGGVAINDGQMIETSASLPTLEEVLNRHVEVMGGAKAINAVSSRVTKATVDLVGVSRGGSFESYIQAPNKALSIIQAHPTGTIKLGFNGRTGWSWSKTGLRTLKGVELATVQRDADLYGTVIQKNNFAKVTLAGMSKIGYRDVYVIDCQPAVGPVERFYLDAQTYLPVRVNTVHTRGGTSEPVEIYLDDWREVDGIKYPFSISQRFPKLTLSYTVTEIKHNVPIDAKIFEPTP